MKYFSTALFLIILNLLGGAVNLFAVEKTPIQITASINPIAMLVKDIGGREVEVSALLSSGKDMHDFELSVKDLVRLNQSKLIFVSGLGLEPWVDGLSSSVAEKVVTLSALTPLEKGDVHTWVDPYTAQKFAEVIALRLCKINSESCSYFEENLKNFTTKITTLNEEVLKMISPLKQKGFAAYHPSWTRFAKRYGLIQLSFVGNGEVLQPTVTDYVNLIKQAKASDVSLLAADIGNSPSAIETLRAEGNFKLVWMDPLGKVGESYSDFMYRNARTLIEGLKESGR